MERPANPVQRRARRRQRVATIAAVLLAGAPRPLLAEAQWITHPAASGPQQGTAAITLQLRSSVDLARVPVSVPVEISADNRYVLYINGKRIDAGPSRGDLAHWRYRQLDLAPFLKVGRNLLAVQVWNDGKAAGVAQISARTGFLLRAGEGVDAALAAQLESGKDWTARIDASRRVDPAQPALAGRVGWAKYFAAPPPETLDAAAQLDGWTTDANVGADWAAAVPALAQGEVTPWTLVADALPQQRLRPLDSGKLVRAYVGLGSDSKAIAAKPGRFPNGAMTVPANSEALIRLDMGAMEAAYLQLVTSGGAGARIELAYAEAPYDNTMNYLADRGAARDGWILGQTDVFLPDGRAKRTFAPLWWRAWRYAELKIRTGAQPLRLESFSRTGTGYPFDVRGHFASNDPELNRIWQIGWNTVQVDGHETYMDTAYWEQLQYVGDTRIQALVTYAVTGDARLAAQAIDAFAASRRNGIIQSRWPANIDQSIPPFALLWVGMLHDYWMRQPDPAPIVRSIDAMRSSLDWYDRYVQPDGLIGTTTGWEFIDWRAGLDNFPETRDPRNTDQCIISLMFVGASQQAAQLEAALGDPARAQENQRRAARTADAVKAKCWSPERGLFADRPELQQFSQHANILAVLYDVAPRDEQQKILSRVLTPGDWPAAPAGITPATFYFDFYLARALVHAGMGENYLDMLKPWRKMLQQNFTTWPENPDPTRSDSHAWSAHPTFDLLTVVAGVDTAAPGFAKVRIAPQLGTLENIDASYAHPQGPINVRLARSPGKRLTGEVRLPGTLSGEFVWGGLTTELRPGRNVIDIGAPAAK